MVIVYDCLSYFAEYIDGIFIEGYDGYIIEEDEKTEKYYIVYKELRGTNEIIKKFLLPDEGSIKQFMKLYELYRQDYFQGQRFLFKALMETEKELIGKERTEIELRKVCYTIYHLPENYLSFIALNVTNAQFFSLANEKILKARTEPLVAA